MIYTLTEKKKLDKLVNGGGGGNYDQDIQNLQQKDTELEQKIEENRVKTNQLASKDNQLMGLIATNQTDISNLKNKDNELKTLIDANDTSIAALEQELGDLQQGVITKTSTEWTTLNNSVGTMGSHVSDLQQNKADLSYVNDELNKKVGTELYDQQMDNVNNIMVELGNTKADKTELDTIKEQAIDESKQYTDTEIAKVQSGGTVDLSNYYTKLQTDTKIQEAIDGITIPDVDLSNVAKLNEDNTFSGVQTYNGFVKFSDKSYIKIVADKTHFQSDNSDVRIISANNKSVELEAGRIGIRSTSDTLPVEINSNKTNINGDLNVSEMSYLKKAHIGVNLSDTNTRKLVSVENFNYNSKNYTALKIVKHQANLLQIEANNDESTVAIAAPAANSFTIDHLSAPTSDRQAANKKYVDDAVANAGGGSVDTTNLAKLNQGVANDWESINTFNNITEFNGQVYVKRIRFSESVQFNNNIELENGYNINLSPNSYVRYQAAVLPQITSEEQIPHKKYVDDEIAKVVAGTGGLTLNEIVELTKMQRLYKTGGTGAIKEFSTEYPIINGVRFKPKTATIIWNQGDRVDFNPYRQFIINFEDTMNPGTSGMNDYFSPSEYLEIKWEINGNTINFTMENQTNRDEWEYDFFYIKWL